MTTPRTIAACEVRPNSRISVSIECGPMERHISGPVNAVDTKDGSTLITFRDNRSEEMDAKHPVTVLAEPEPKWVEGAWYRLQVNGNKTHARRVEAGWVRWGHVSIPSWEDSDLGRNITVLGRVLIVDWPGDDVADGLLEDWPECNSGVFRAPENVAAQALADAIRTQGGVR